MTSSSTPSSSATPSSNNQHPIQQQLAALQATKQQNASPSPAIPPLSVPPQKTRLTWTGFQGKTAWDWLDFLIKLLGALAIPLVVVLASNALNTQQQQTADIQHKNELAIANDQQKETTLTTYLDDMTSLLLNNDLHASKPTDEVRNVARIKTLTTLRRLDGNRKGILVQFLYEARLIDQLKPIINLSGANLSGANLPGALLSGADLSGADLSGADLYGANLHEVNLSGADLSGADLVYAYLHGTDLGEAFLGEARLVKANLTKANLPEIDLYGADLSGADLSGANLYEANLTKAIVTNAQLVTAYSLQDTILPNGSRHP